jgi:hypothetical protein
MLGFLLRKEIFIKEQIIKLTMMLFINTITMIHMLLNIFMLITIWLWMSWDKIAVKNIFKQIKVPINEVERVYLVFV